MNYPGSACGTEALGIVRKGAADFATIDRTLRNQVRFKVGSFKLTTLTAPDVWQSAMASTYYQYYKKTRYRHSVAEVKRLAGDMAGRKPADGSCQHSKSTIEQRAKKSAPDEAKTPPFWLVRRASRRSGRLERLKTPGHRVETGPSALRQALPLFAQPSLAITTVAVVERPDLTRTVASALLIDDAATKRRVLATKPVTPVNMRDASLSPNARDSKAVGMVQDGGSFVTQRVVSASENIAKDICQQGACSPRDVEPAVTPQLEFCTAPLAKGNSYGPTCVVGVLSNIQMVSSEQRYHPSPRLRRRGAIGISVMHQEN